MHVPGKHRCACLQGKTRPRNQLFRDPNGRPLIATGHNLRGHIRSWNTHLLSKMAFIKTSEQITRHFLDMFLYGYTECPADCSDRQQAKSQCLLSNYENGSLGPPPPPKQLHHLHLPSWSPGPVACFITAIVLESHPGATRVQESETHFTHFLLFCTLFSPSPKIPRNQSYRRLP